MGIGAVEHANNSGAVEHANNSGLWNMQMGINIVVRGIRRCGSCD